MNKKLQHVLSATLFSVFVFMAFGSDDKKNESSNDKETSEKPDVEILSHNAKYESTMNSYTVHCRVKNNTQKLITYVDISATFYDSEGKIVGTGLGNGLNLAAGAEKTIDVIALGIENSEKYEVQINNILY